MTAHAASPHHILSNGDIEIVYRRFGAGPLLVLLHGFPDDVGSWSAQVEDLARDHLVVTPRLRGFPPSSVPEDPGAYALPAVASDIDALIAHVNAGPAILIGHDWGGALAQVVALLYPTSVSGLVVVNAPPLSRFNSVVHASAKQQAMSAYTLPYLGYRPGDDKNVAEVVRNIRDPHWRDHVARYLAENRIDGMMGYYKANYSAPPYAPEPPAGHVFGLPTLILWGLEEEYFSPEALDDLARYFPASLRLVTIPGAGHWAHRDAPDRVNAEIRSWLEQLPGLAPSAPHPHAEPPPPSERAAIS